MAGVSRSVSLVLAYLMKHHNMSYQEAYQSVKRRRKIIHPNDGFIRQLKDYQQQLNRQRLAMRRSCDNFKSAPQHSSPLRSPPSYMGASLYQRPTPYKNSAYNPESHSRGHHYKTEKDNDNSFSGSQALKHLYNSKYKIPRSGTNKTHFSYTDINRELDEKINSIRQKYVEATELLSKVDRPRYERTAYVDRVGYARPSPANYSTVESEQRLRGSSIGNYMQSRMKHGFSFLENY